MSVLTELKKDLIYLQNGVEVDGVIAIGYLNSLVADSSQRAKNSGSKSGGLTPCSVCRAEGRDLLFGSEDTFWAPQELASTPLHDSALWFSPTTNQVPDLLHMELWESGAG
ncbi:hypothetical protein ADUPG1_013395 [Aduncisulcus paluster]|uniref:Uncharacterized protein n=1 Tax=Aduncisulcus paluster TaxID=2918883 RepID=A0ABQ5K6E7_9EUKA|nr:hypothetical protein ADUPG1_013395 [Aduncisulcus paluster]